MALMLDTNALSAFADGDPKLGEAIDGEDELALPVMVLGEYLFGIEESRARRRYEEWLRRNLPLFRILEAGRETAWHYAGVRRELKRKGRPIPSNDIWIAALTREHGTALLTRDRHFDDVPDLRVVSW